MALQWTLMQLLSWTSARLCDIWRRMMRKYKSLGYCGPDSEAALCAPDGGISLRARSLLWGGIKDTHQSRLTFCTIRCDLACRKATDRRRENPARSSLVTQQYRQTNGRLEIPRMLAVTVVHFNTILFLQEAEYILDNFWILGLSVHEDKGDAEAVGCKHNTSIICLNNLLGGIRA